MSDVGTSKMLRRYDAAAPPTMFLASHFAAPPKNLHNKKTVEIDVVRHGRSVAPVLTEISADGELLSSGKATNKEFEPPVTKLHVVTDAQESANRVPGQDAYQETQYNAQLGKIVIEKAAFLTEPIDRQIELQASTILQTGKVTLPRKGGGVFEVDYLPKATHFPTAGVDWGNGAEDKLQDLLNLSKVNKTDGKVASRKCIFGETAWLEWQADSGVQAILDNRRISNGEIKPRMAAEDATFQGTFQIAGFKFEMWTYDASYDAYGTESDTPYVDPENVIVMADNQQRAPLEATYGEIPKFPGDPQALSFVPRTMGKSGGRNMTVSAWFNENRTALTVEAGTRPLLIPIAIDSFGCLKTVA